MNRENDTILTKLGLEHAGLKHPIYSVLGGLEAIAYLNGDPPYRDRGRYPLPFLVLLDIKMPRVDGFDVLRWVRQQPRFANLPEVMLTGSEDGREANTAYQLGASSFFVKSLDFANAAELSRSVERLIAR
jgi:CheY-like chemotaxis protein